MRIEVPSDPMKAGRVNKALNKIYSFDGVVKSLRCWIEDQLSICKTEGTGETEFNRNHFNRLDSNDAQNEYLERLRLKRKFYINNVEVPKLVYDAVRDSNTDGFR